MSAPKHRYELWAHGYVIAKYNTLGQALLGAAWRSRKRKRTVYIWAAKPHKFVAFVRAGDASASE